MNTFFSSATVYASSDHPSSGSFGSIRPVLQPENFSLSPQISRKINADPAPTFLTLTFKIKSLKPSLRRVLQKGGEEVNRVWNYCNAISSKAIADRNTWLSAFDFNKLLTGSLTFSENNPDGFHVINSAIAQATASEYVTRRNQFHKKKLKWRRSHGSRKNGRSLTWIPLKEENLSITYPYTFTHTTGKKTVSITKNIRVAGKNTSEDHTCALFSLPNDSGKPFGLPSHLGHPHIKALGHHIKIFNEKHLSYYLYHLEARVKAGRLTQNTLGEAFLHLVVAVPTDVYQEKHLAHKLKIPEVAPQECIGLDPGAHILLTDSEGTEYYADGTRQHNSTDDPFATLRHPTPLTPHQKLDSKIRQAQKRRDLRRVRALHLKAHNQLVDTSRKIALDLIRQFQFIRMGNLNIKAVVKNRTVVLSARDYKKKRSERRRQAGRLKQQSDEHNDSSSSSTKNTKNTKKRQGFGQSLLTQGLGFVKLRLSFFCLVTGRSYREMSEWYTTQGCCNCDQLTGPRGLKQLGTRVWVCMECGTLHLRDHCSAVNLKKGPAFQQAIQPAVVARRQGRTWTTPQAEQYKKRFTHNGQACVVREANQGVCFLSCYKFHPCPPQMKLPSLTGKAL